MKGASERAQAGYGRSGVGGWVARRGGEVTKRSLPSTLAAMGLEDWILLEPSPAPL